MWMGIGAWSGWKRMSESRAFGAVLCSLEKGG